ncbi:hypothetical protein A2704_07090 [Candidatus Kaiserbacteria bacterium RIFCSPHIGHO2_01_FULL_54_36b]|uniref:Uncharacterized protein n=1 Tax=Candidatus Kaiserbacteria bacterium RIFCSPHIGHO2_01_FULL_54_36b TaxID=1798483 RepID=A0A1F6CRP6_9BACT|nr:MAG: hypothetical protein A2704_07090 [Candidatus Kaiserbacteria bacterium RIFCSPHIGHO2_01_FULL_54_36b]
MLFAKKVVPAPVLSIQAAQCTGLTQALALVKRIWITATSDEKESFNCAERFRLLDFYGIKLTEIINFEHVDADRAKGSFRFWTPRLVAIVELSLEREKTVLTTRSEDGFTETTVLDRWKSVQASVRVHRSWRGEFSTFPDESVFRMRGAALESTDELPLEVVPID